VSGWMERSKGTDGERPRMECTEPDCTERAAVRLHVPWDENRVVCTGCARSLAQRDGVVAEPIAEREDEWP